MAIAARAPIHGAYFSAPYGRIGRAMRMNPYVPIFSMIAASSTEPIVGASVWASGSHVWNGHIGTLTANPSPTAPNTTSWNPCEKPPCCAYRWSSTMSNVLGSAVKNMARKPSSMNTEPNKVYRKNLIAAYSRLALPQIPIRKYMGTRTSSQNTKNRIKSNAMNVPAMPVSSTSINARNPFALPGLGTNRHVYTAQRNEMANVSTYRGRLIPSIPTWNRAEIAGIHDVSSSNCSADPPP